MKLTFFRYTGNATDGRSSWSRRAARLWFWLRTLPTRLRFASGRASFVEADVRMTTHSVADVSEAAGRPFAPRLLTHYHLRTASPRGGAAGWSLFLERVPGSQHQTVALDCLYCGHRFVVQVLTAIDPLANELTGSKGPGAPASYASEWFRFLHQDYDGPAYLNCPRCEQPGAPRVDVLVTRS